jgi:lipoprotein-anchoring transpeptidase ErfK/SrfK
MNIDSILESYAHYFTQPWLLVDVSKQCLYVMQDSHVTGEYKISTSRYGLGCQQDSYKTPTGAHAIKQKIGDGAAIGEIFKGRQATGQQAQISTQAEHDDEDLILTRICWLIGLEPGKNAGAGVDSYARYIYIHGTQEEGLLGRAVSKGCIRMANCSLVDLFERVKEGTFIYIAERLAMR